MQNYKHEPRLNLSVTQFNAACNSAHVFHYYNLASV